MELAQPATVQAVLEHALNRVKTNCSTYGLEFPTRGYPAYETAPNNHWVAGFWPGMLWLAYHATQDSELRAKAEALLSSFDERLRRRVDLSHDLGFLYTLSARAAWLLTGNRLARDLGLWAAREQGRRFNPRGNYIQAWGEIGEEPEAGRMIIDCMMNLPLLYWAGEETKDNIYCEVAHHHAVSTLRWLQCWGVARPVERPDWQGLLPEGASIIVSPDDLYLVVRMRPERIDLVDEGQGWGVRETLNL